MKKIEIIPPKELKNNEIAIPGSKSYTNRALVMAALGIGKSIIKGYSEGDDSKALIQALEKLGIKIEKSDDGIMVHGNGGKFSQFKGKIDVGAAGTTMRFLTSLCCLAPGEIILDGSERMRERPIEELVEALKSLGANIEYLEKGGFPPLKIKGGNIKGGEISMNGSVSSQYFTSLFLIAPCLEDSLKIKVKGEQISKSYIDMTINGLKSFGVEVLNNNYKEYVVNSREKYKSIEYQVEGDASGASYFFGIAAVTRLNIRVSNINPNSNQGDIVFVNLLEEMGCKVIKNEKENWIEVKGPEKLKSIECNMELMPDVAQTLAVVASFAEGKTKIMGLSTLKIKETDRIQALKNELDKMGIRVEADNDFIVIYGGNPKGVEIETYRDHRMAMAFSIAGCRISGVKILDPGVVSKSFPDFWEKLKELGVEILRK